MTPSSRNPANPAPASSPTPPRNPTNPTPTNAAPASSPTPPRNPTNPTPTNPAPASSPTPPRNPTIPTPTNPAPASSPTPPRNPTNPTPPSRRLAVRLLALTVSLLLVAAACSGDENGDDDLALPDVELATLDGGTYPLVQTGKPRALNLWATWCAPCRAELPAFDDVASRVEGVDIVGINTGDDAESAAELVDELALSFPQTLDETAAVQQALRITGMPSTIFVDAEGTILEVHSGDLEIEEIESRLVDHFGATFTD